MHTFRLLYSALNIMENGEPLVRFAGEKLQELRDIRAGRFGYDELVAKAEALADRLVAGHATLPLLENSDIQRVNALLLDITRQWEKDHER